jgi:hypothetical protein
MDPADFCSARIKRSNKNRIEYKQNFYFSSESVLNQNFYIVKYTGLGKRCGKIVKHIQCLLDRRLKSLQST